MDPQEDNQTDISETEEYKDLFNKAKRAYPDEYDYIIHLACLSYFKGIDFPEPEES